MVAKSQTIEVDAETAAALKNRAAERGVSVSQLLSELLPLAVDSNTIDELDRRWAAIEGGERTVPHDEVVRWLKTWGNAGLQALDRLVNIEWSAAALADLDRFARFLRTDFPNLAAVVAQEIIAKADAIAANPRLGRALDGRKSFRQVVLRVLNAPYVFQYRYDGQRLVILRVFHSRERR